MQNLTSKTIARLERIDTAYAPMNKLQIVFVFQITTQVPRVYEVAVPSIVHEFLETSAVVVSLGLTSVATTPLECVGFAGYQPRLIFWMIVPILFVMVIVAAVLSSAMWQRSFPPWKPASSTDNGTHDSNVHHESQRRPNTLEATLQPVLVLMFVLYPKVCARG
jgi:hypothetical protein